jgi:hypothetical protein
MFSAALIQALQGAWPHLAGEALVRLKSLACGRSEAVLKACWHELLKH